MIQFVSFDSQVDHLLLLNHIIIAAELPVLSDDLSLTPTTSSIMVSWTPPEFSPGSYNVTFACQLLCETEPYTESYNIIDGTANAHTILNLEPGNNCTVSIAGVFGNSIGNTINSSIDTNSARKRDISLTMLT